MSCGRKCLCHFAHLLSFHQASMKQPLPKRRRVSSNPLTPFSSSGTLAASPKPSKISTCTSCHRAIGLKSSPAFLCTRSAAYCVLLKGISLTILGEHYRCSAPSCAICLRTCTSDSAPSPCLPGSLNLPPDSIAFPLSQSNKNISCLRRRRPRDEDSDNVLKTKEVDDGRTGCGRAVCRTCCLEHPQRSESSGPPCHTLG